MKKNISNLFLGKCVSFNVGLFTPKHFIMKTLQIREVLIKRKKFQQIWKY